MKRVLLISYYFPPCGGAAVQRWLRFIRFLPEHGWQPTVITTFEGDYPVFDSSLCKKIPGSVEVIRTKTPVFNKMLNLIKAGQGEGVPYGSLKTKKEDSLSKKALYWLRLNMIAPDSRVLWNKYAYNSALKQLREKRFDLVVTTGPPHSTHLVGLELKKRFPIKWIADFRDPWTKIYYLQDVTQNRLLEKLNRKYEKSVIEKADLNVIISQPVADSFPEGNKRVLSNGFDPEDYFNINTVTSPFFRIKYVGELTEGQDISTPLSWLNSLCRDQKTGNIEFSFIGAKANLDSYKRTYPNLHIRNLGFINHLRAVSEMVNADILLLLINNCPDNKGIFTTKLFEYIGSKTYILGIGPTDGEAAKIIEQYKAGNMIAYQNRDGFENVVKKLYRLWQNNKNIKNKTDIKELSTPFLVKELSKIFDQVTEIPPSS